MLFILSAGDHTLRHFGSRTIYLSYSLAVSLYMVLGKAFFISLQKLNGNELFTS